MNRFEAKWYLSQRKNIKPISLQDLIKLADKANVLEEEEQRIKAKEQKLFGYPDKVLSRKEK